MRQRAAGEPVREGAATQPRDETSSRRRAAAPVARPSRQLVRRDDPTQLPDERRTTNDERRTANAETGSTARRAKRAARRARHY
ncbi:hypothetical protein AQ809_09645 [Burkholderia pseudomallei]|nr:hypothetical protein AQ809_09645 [Burkholderia pseudomallei]